MDVHYLERVLMSVEDGIKPSALPVEFANGVLRIRTKTEVWVVKGEKQRLAVAYMYEQAQYGRGPVKFWQPRTLSVVQKSLVEV
jgi:hypothetical protein